MTAKTVTACVLVIGNEILSGRTKDANLAWLAVELNKLGVRLMEARVIPDVEETIVATLNEVRARFDYVFTTGGIGPTHDDITAACVARAFAVPLVRNPEAVRRLQAHYANPADLNEARLRMANAPEGATLIDNPVSKAPGFRIGNVHVMAGIPVIMQAMFDGIRHTLVGGSPMLSRTINADSDAFEKSRVPAPAPWMRTWPKPESTTGKSVGKLPVSKNRFKSCRADAVGVLGSESMRFTQSAGVSTWDSPETERRRWCRPSKAVLTEPEGASTEDPS